MSKKFDVAVVGATGAVGEEMLKILKQRKFPVGKVYAIASARSAGEFVDFGDEELEVHDLATFDFSKTQIGLFSPGADVSKVYAPKAAAAGCVVIDNTSQFRYDKDIPLVVPEVNPKDIALYKTRGIIVLAMFLAGWPLSGAWLLAPASRHVLMWISVPYIAVLISFLVYVQVTFRCPRCGLKFIGGKSARSQDRKVLCPHCGLPYGALSNPDPNWTPDKISN